MNGKHKVQCSGSWGGHRRRGEQLGREDFIEIDGFEFSDWVEGTVIFVIIL